MPRPKILDDLYSHLDSTDNPHSSMNWVSATGVSESVDEPLPTDADTLEGHPASYFASKTEVSQILSNYIATVLGSSY